MRGVCEGRKEPVVADAEVEADVDEATEAEREAMDDVEARKEAADVDCTEVVEEAMVVDVREEKERLCAAAVLDVERLVADADVAVA